MVTASRSLQAGQFDVPPLEVSGPKELSQATQAFNDMSSTLCAVQAHAVALSGSNLDDPVLRTPLPGETGRALQDTLTTLSESIQDNQRQRTLLGERATHDSLTGLLNRVPYSSSWSATWPGCTVKVRHLASSSSTWTD